MPDLIGVTIGFVSGVTKTLVTYPFDTIKSNVQRYDTRPLEATRQIYRRGGFSGFYRGVMYPIAGSSIAASVFYETYLRLRETSLGWLAAPVSGSLTAVIVSPLEKWKILGQTGLTMKLPLYRGLDSFMIRNWFGYGIYINSFEFLRHQTELYDTVGGKIVGSTVAGTIGCGITYPLDVIKTNVQSGRGRNFFEAARLMFNQHGVSWMYRGLSVHLMKYAPRGTIELMIVSMMMPKIATSSEASDDES